jgi:uncharacterized protein (DUF2235 family)
VANGPRNLIVLSDGTGNSAAKANKTNVWRLYQAIDLTGGSQIAAFSDGVGTSSVRLFRVLGLALGIGVKRNVLGLYKFLCRNYKEGDRIWAFGFSRGAFTIRVLAGLIYREGLIAWETEAELNRNALAAYRSYRRKAFKTRLPWVIALRWIRDSAVLIWNALTQRRSYKEVQKKTAEFGRAQKPVYFVGVWDTVAAYGLPVDELTQAVDTCVWPLTFASRDLLPNVEHARHALSLDDDRRTFHPIPWDENAETALIRKGAVKPDRLLQVWFAGAHADVGGGYPDDGLSLVALNWMIREAAAMGLRFAPPVAAEFEALAAPTGRIYDPRSGFGALWRYQPRDAQKILGEGIIPVVHWSVMTRIVSGTEGYAPISLPEEIKVLPPHGPPVAFTRHTVAQALAQAKTGAASLLPAAQQEQERALEGALQAATDFSNVPLRAERFDLVLDTVWWRRVNYFVSLFLALTAAVFPLTAEYLQIGGVTRTLDETAGGSIGWIMGAVSGLLPSFAAPWVDALVAHPAGAAIVLLGLYTSLRVSASLQQRICDRARACWVPPARTRVRLLQPTGQRGALLTAALLLAIFAGFIGSAPAIPHAQQWVEFLLTGFAACGAVWAVRRFYLPPLPVDPAKPGLLLGLARRLRKSPAAKGLYRFTARKALPAAFLFLTAAAVLFAGNRLAFDLLSAGGMFCAASAPADGEQLDVPVQFRTSSLCQATGIRLVKGRKYRIRLDMEEGPDGDWFDKGIRTDVAGFGSLNAVLFSASPLKRWWFENWFAPIARIGHAGNYEHALRPAAPLPAGDFAKCPTGKPKEAWETGIAPPAPGSYKSAQIA